MKKYLRFATTIGLWTLLSRLLGLIRDVLCAAFLGTSWVWDSFILAWTLPNLFRRLFGEGALSLAFIPLFAEKWKQKGSTKAMEFASAVFSWLSKILFFLTLGVVSVSLILTYFPLPEKHIYTLYLTAILFPYVWFICLAALCGGVLQSLERFSLPACLPLLLNLLWIGALLLGYTLELSPKNFGYLLSLTLLFGGALQFSTVFLPLRKKGLCWSSPQKEEQLPKVKKLLIPVVWSLAILQVNVLLDRWMAEICVPESGAVSALYYGNRLIQLPLALIATSLGVALFPGLSKEAAQKDEKAFSRTLLWGLQVTSFLTLPAAFGLALLSSPIVSLLFERGAFQSQDTLRTAKVLLFYSPSVFFYSLIQILTRAFYARKDAKTPVRISTYCVLANLVFNLVLVFPLKEAGLALATSLTALGNCLCLFYFFQKEHKLLSLKKILSFLATCLLLNFLMSGTILLLWPHFPKGQGFWTKLLQVALGIASGVGSYGLLGSILYFVSKSTR